MAKYIVFNNKTELDEANTRYIAEKRKLGIYDTIRGIPVNPQITTKFTNGEDTKDGKIACEVPKTLKEKFGGTEKELSVNDIVKVEEIVIEK